MFLKLSEIKVVSLFAIAVMFILNGGGYQYLYADVPNEIRYNGKLRSYNKEVNGSKDIRFSIYDVAENGTAKWTENITSVNISSGIFSCVLSPTSSVDWRNQNFWIEVEIENNRFTPREKLTSVPYALHSASAEKISVKSGSSFNVKIGDSDRFSVSDTDAEFVHKTTGKKYYMVPAGTIVIWSGSADSIPDGWVLCDGKNGTPDLRDKFVLGAGLSYAVKSSDGSATHTLDEKEMPSHTHNFTVYARAGTDDRSDHLTGGSYSSENDGSYSGTTTATGGGQSHSHMPPYYALCYIMRIER